MSSSHFVNTCTIDVGYNHAEKARSLQAKVSQIFHAELNKAILEVFDDFNADDEILSIDLLEIDLGEIEEEMLREEFPRRLKEKLKQALAKLITTQADTLKSSTTIKSFSSEERHIIALEQFLLSGFIAWQYRNITTSYDGFIEKILHEYPASLAVLIKKNSANQVFLERLVKQFGSDKMHRVIQILSPNEAVVVIETVKKIQWLELKEKILSVPQTSFENSVWELALLYLVRDRGSYFNNKDFIRSVIKGLAARYNVDFVSYLSQIHRAVQYLAQHHTFKYAFPHLLEELYHESALQQDNSMMQSSSQQKELALNFYLEHGYLNGDQALFTKADLESVWGEYAHASTLQQITEFLKKHINHPTIRFRTISLIREEGSKKIVEYVEPANAPFIFAFADKLQHEQEEWIFNITTDSKTFRLMKWDFVIHTLLNNRGSVFNTKVFILRTIQAMADRYGQTFETLLGLILRSVPATSAVNPGGNIVAALQLIKKEYNTSSIKNYPSENSPSLKLKPLLVLLSGKTKLSKQKQNELISLIAELYSSSNKHAISLLTKGLSEGALPIEQIVKDPELAKNIGRISPTLQKALDRAKAKKASNTIDDNLLIRDIRSEIERLFQLPKKQHKGISQRLYHLLLRLFSKPSQSIPAALRQLLVSDQFVHQLVLTKTEETILHNIAPDWFVASHNRPSQQTINTRSSDLNEGATISLLLYYTLHASLPWWATVAIEKKQTVDQIVTRLLKHPISSTKDQLVVLLKEKKKRSVLLGSLSNKTIVTMATKLGNIPDKNLKYYLNLVEQVNKEQPLIQNKNSSFSADQWDIVLETLLEDRGSNFNLKTFLRSTLKKLAAHFNINYTAMLRSIHQLINKSRGDEKNTFNRILDELTVESKDEQEKKTAIKTNKEQATPSDEIDGGMEHSPQATFQLQLLTALKKIHNSGFQPNALQEIEELIQQLDSGKSTALLQMLKSLDWSVREWSQLWSLLDDTVLTKLYETLTHDLLFIKSYHTDWEKFLHYHFVQYSSSTSRKFYTLTLLYLVTHEMIEKHAWFSFVLSGYESAFDKRDNLIKALNHYFETESNLLVSTIQLSFKKWKSPATTENLKSIASDKTVKQKEPEKQKVNTKKATDEPVLKEEDKTQDHWVQNCGLVLIWPFLEKYFSLLDLLEERKFKTPEAAYRAVHLLQYLTCGKEGYPEYQLVLNKILCGVKVAKPIVKDLTLTDKEKQVSEDLLKGVIQHWSILGNTSLEGLRTTFLMREGLLKKKTDWDQLHVERKAFDVLIDRIPWSYSIVKLPWMERAIHVVWK